MLFCPVKSNGSAYKEVADKRRNICGREETSNAANAVVLALNELKEEKGAMYNDSISLSSGKMGFQHSSCLSCRGSSKICRCMKYRMNL